MTCLVIGATGFTGAPLLSRLRVTSPDASLIGADVHDVPPSDLDLDEYHRADITDAESVHALVLRTQPDWVINLAGKPSGTAESIYRTHVLGAVNLLEAVRTSRHHARVLLVGSAAEYGTVESDANPIPETHPCEPVSHYGASKYAATLVALSYVRQFGLSVNVARPFNIIGPDTPKWLVLGAVIGRVIAAVHSADPVIRVGNVETQRDFVDVEDAVDAYVRIVQSPNRGEVFNVCSGRPFSVRAMVDTIVGFAPASIQVQIDPVLCKTSDVPVIFGDGRKARELLGFEPQHEIQSSLRRAWFHAWAHHPLHCRPA